MYDETPEHFAAVVATSPALGAGIVGGCCGTPPAYIAALAAALGRWRLSLRAPRHRCDPRPARHSASIRG